MSNITWEPVEGGSVTIIGGREYEVSHRYDLSSGVDHWTVTLTGIGHDFMVEFGTERKAQSWAEEIASTLPALGPTLLALALYVDTCPYNVRTEPGQKAEVLDEGRGGVCQSGWLAHLQTRFASCER